MTKIQNVSTKIWEETIKNNFLLHIPLHLGHMDVTKMGLGKLLYFMF